MSGCIIFNKGLLLAGMQEKKASTLWRSTNEISMYALSGPKVQYDNFVEWYSKSTREVKNHIDMYFERKTNWVN